MTVDELVDDDDEYEDDETLDEVLVVSEDAEDAPTPGEEAGSLTLRLSTDLRRRLRRRADREGVTAEELAEELLGAAIRRPAAESLTEVLARLDKLERSVAELGVARPRSEAPAAARRPEERPRGDFGSRNPSSGFGDRVPSERPAYGDRGSYAGPRRQDDRPRFGERPPSGGFGRPEGRFGDRPRNDAPDRGPSRPFERRNDREDTRDRPPRRWESPRRGE